MELYRKNDGQHIQHYFSPRKCPYGYSHRHCPAASQSNRYGKPVRQGRKPWVLLQKTGAKAYISLAVRLYNERGIDAQVHSGHKSADTTAAYRETYGAEWTEIKLADRYSKTDCLRMTLSSGARQGSCRLSHATSRRNKKRPFTFKWQPEQMDI